jgi:uncharacterized repeat protein (TIGR01451 family)
VAGAITITGQGGPGIGDNEGILIESGGQVTSTGTGVVAIPATITLNGTGGVGGGFGVDITGTGTRVTSLDGKIAITGQGGVSSGIMNQGILIEAGGQVTSTGTGTTAATITLNGTGSPGGGSCVDIKGMDSLVTSEAGNMTLTGQGGTGGGDNMGVLIEGGGQVTSTGTGARAAAITVTGTGQGTATGTGQNDGVHIRDTSRVASVDGAIQLTGTAGLGGNSISITLRDTSKVSATGSTPIIFRGDSMTLAGGTLVQAVAAVILDAGLNGRNSTITLAGTVRGTTVTVHGRSGNDALVIDYTAGASLPNGIGFDGTGSANSLTLSDANGPAAHTYTINATNLIRDGAAPLIYSQVQKATITGGDKADTFNVTPSAATAFFVNGGLPNPPELPGDTLQVDLTGTTNARLTRTFGPEGFAGSWTFGNRQPITFTGMETLIPNPGDEGLTTHVAVSLKVSAPTVAEGDALTYTLTVRNTSPIDARGVTLTLNLSAITSFTSASFSQGTATHTAGVVTANLGTVAAGASVTGTVVVRVIEDGMVTASTSVASTTADPDPTGHSDSTTLTATEPAVVITPMGVSGFELTALTNVTVATFTHAGAVEPTSAFSATIRWGDGMNSQGQVSLAGSSYTVQGSHTYSDEGSFLISIEVVHGGATTTATTNATVLEELLPDGTRGTANQRFVLEVYRDLLHRTISAQELPLFTAWVSYLDRHSRADLVMQFQTAPEFLVNQIQDLYQGYLLRAADPTGLNDALSLLQHGGSREQVGAGILGSVEYFRDRAASDANRFLDVLFQDLHRTPLTGSDRSAALQALTTTAGRSSFTVAAQNSDEYRNALVSDIYRRFLHRETDAVGLRNWPAALRQGVLTDQGVLASIIGDSTVSEFFNKTAP